METTVSVFVSSFTKRCIRDINSFMCSAGADTDEKGDDAKERGDADVEATKMLGISFKFVSISSFSGRGCCW